MAFRGAMRQGLTASAAQKKRTAADKKMMDNVTKRGTVPDMAVERRKGKLSTGPILIAFFTIVLVGSTLLQIFNKASSGSDR